MFGAGGAFFTKNGTKGERKGRFFIRTLVAESFRSIRQVRLRSPGPRAPRATPWANVAQFRTQSRIPMTSFSHNEFMYRKNKTDGRGSGSL